MFQTTTQLCNAKLEIPMVYLSLVFFFNDEVLMSNQLVHQWISWSKRKKHNVGFDMTDWGYILFHHPSRRLVHVQSSPHF